MKPVEPEECNNASVVYADDEREKTVRVMGVGMLVATAVTFVLALLGESPYGIRVRSDCHHCGRLRCYGLPREHEV